MSTLAERAVELGLTTTDWFDTSQGHPGVERRATISPHAADWLSRYGTNGSMIEYNPRNWAGAHAPAGNTDAPIVYVEVFRQIGKPIERTANDLSDLDLIDGLTRFVMDQAARLRITANGVLGQDGGTTQPFPPPLPPVVPVDPNPQPINPSPPVDPCASVKAELVASTQKLVLVQASLRSVNAELDAANYQLAASQKLTKQIAKLVNSVTIPTRGGGAAWNVLRQIVKLYEKVEA